MRARVNFAFSSLFLMLAMSALAQPAHPSAPDARPGVILSAAESRFMPNLKAEAYWTPTHTQVQRLEAELKRYSRAGDFPPPPGVLPPDLLGYYRQYAGVVVGGHRLIYVNGFSPVVAPEFIGGTHDWHHHPVFVDDGGSDFFHVTYNPSTHRFTDFEFNGLG